MKSAIKCRICDSKDNHQRFILKEMMFGSNEEFEYFKCSHCGCLQITDIPSNLSRFYPDNYYSYQKPISDKTSKIYTWLQKQRCKTAMFGKGVKFNRILSRFIDLPYEWYKTGPLLKKALFKNFDDAILDIGCGEHSNWLIEIKKFGFKNLIGIDPFIKMDKEEQGITYYKKSLLEMEGKFKYITFHHSLEHIPDQISQLEAASNLLSPGGICLVRIPLVSSYVWEKYGASWVELDAPRHLYLHTNKSIKLLGEKAGLRLIDTIYDSDEFEFAASEQYQVGIPLFDERSYLVNPKNSIFSNSQMDEFRKEAERVNREGSGGRAGFYFAANK
ncbi:class I SAM-dependent methyltransferase [Methylomonas sp. BW4-1]|uniref:class I SAM-dependent methyltransferase n=1 Tax=unclassified Methylomonas TaxID=2608980 RepID=UPI0039F517B8